jgi:hypothetical protein
MLFFFVVCGCGPTSDGVNAGGDTGVGDAGQTPDAGSGSDADTAFDAGPTPDAFAGTPVRELPGLLSITFWERTGGDAPTEYTFDVQSDELTHMLPDPLTAQNYDIIGVPSSEYYDVYYSDADGVFDIDGQYLTISGVFGGALPGGGGLNLAEMQLNFESTAPPEFGSEVASFAALGDNAHPENVDLCIDNDLDTHTTMGNTVGSTERLRITLGFESTQIVR